MPVLCRVPVFECPHASQPHALVDKDPARAPAPKTPDRPAAPKSVLVPEREWWTPAAIAASGLPDLPTTPYGVAALALRLNWHAATKFIRRSGPGSWEYNWKLFPNAAQRELIKRSIASLAAEARARDQAAKVDCQNLSPAILTFASDQCMLNDSPKRPMVQHTAAEDDLDEYCSRPPMFNSLAEFHPGRQAP